MNKLWKIGKDFGIITLGTMVAACGVFFFLVPSRVTVGSVSGLSVVLAQFLPLPVSALTMVMNLALLSLGLVLIGVEFCKRTVIASVLLPVFIGILERLFPAFTSLTGDPFLDMLGYILVTSMAMAVLFHQNASTGGLDIVAKILNKYLRMDLGQAGALAGMVVAMSSVFTCDSKAVFLSLLGTWLQGIVVDHFIFGLRIKKRVCILSEREAEIKHFILHDLHSGATLYEAIGAYDERVRREIITIVDKNEYARLMNYIARTDPKAFVTVYAVNEIIYRPKTVV